MKLPEEKQKELEESGKPKSTPVPGGRALGRLRQFEKERGLDKTNPVERPGSAGKRYSKAGDQESGKSRKGVGERSERKEKTSSCTLAAGARGQGTGASSSLRAAAADSRN